MKKVILIPCALLLLTACLSRQQISSATPQPSTPLFPPESLAVFKDGMTPPYQPGLSSAGGASIYRIRFDIADDIYHISGSESVQYTNQENTVLNEIQFRLFPNILGGTMKVEDVSVDGKTIKPGYSLQNSLLILPLPNGLQPNKTVTLNMNFSESIARDVYQNYGVQAYSNNVLALAHAYPMIAVFDDEGWNAEIPPPAGDVTYADASFFYVTITAPENLVIGATGRQVHSEASDGVQTVSYVAGPARDFYLAASPDYQVFTIQKDGITLKFYAPKENKAGAEYALDVAAKALRDFSRRYAPYPYTELTFVTTPTLALGIEYPGAIAITRWVLTPGNKYLEATIAHEVGHQWFYNLVGDDQLDDPWLDESLTQFATMEYYLDEYGQSGYNNFRADLESRWSSVGEKKIPLGKPVAFYTDAEYSAIVYGRGGLFFEALQEKLGRQAFDDFMKDYVNSQVWGIATPESLKSIAEKHCVCDLTQLFKDWIY